MCILSDVDSADIAIAIGIVIGLARGVISVSNRPVRSPVTRRPGDVDFLEEDLEDRRK